MVHGALNALSRAGEHIEALAEVARQSPNSEGSIGEARLLQEAVQHAGGAFVAIGQAVVYALIDIAQNTRRD